MRVRGGVWRKNESGGGGPARGCPAPATWRMPMPSPTGLIPRPPAASRPPRCGCLNEGDSGPGRVGCPVAAVPHSVHAATCAGATPSRLLSIPYRFTEICRRGNGYTDSKQGEAGLRSGANQRMKMARGQRGRWCRAAPAGSLACRACSLSKCRVIKYRLFHPHGPRQPQRHPPGRRQLTQRHQPARPPPAPCWLLRWGLPPAAWA